MKSGYLRVSCCSGCSRCGVLRAKSQTAIQPKQLKCVKLNLGAKISRSSSVTQLYLACKCVAFTWTSICKRPSQRLIVSSASEQGLLSPAARTMTIRHPFQKLCCVPASESHDGPLLFAASGPNIFTFQLRSGKSTSRWSALEGPDHPLIKAIPNPNKRVKLDPNQDGSLSRQDSEESIEISVERQKGERRKLKVEQPKSCNVSHVLATSNGQTLLAVTTDDKTIHIFDIMGKGGLLVPKSSRSGHPNTSRRCEAHVR